MTATIIRKKVWKTFMTPGYAWKWFYDVEGLGVTLAGFSYLSEAISMAKRHGATEIIKQWKVEK